MPDRIQSQKIICEGGLNTSQNFLVLSDTAMGSAVSLINYEAALSGGYRRVNGYAKIDDTYSEVTNGTDIGTGAVLGLFGFLTTSGAFEIIAARRKSGGSTYKFYKFAAGVGWSSINTGTTQSVTGVSRIRSRTFMTETGNNIVFVDGVNKALVYDGTNWYQLSSGSSGGSGSPGGDQVLDKPSVVTYFKGSVFLSGDSSAPAVVSYSAPNDPLTWTAASGGGQMIAGFPVVQLHPFRDENYIFGVSAIRKALPDEAAGFVLQDVTNNIGCIARDSVVELAGSLVFLSPDGIRPVAGTDKIGDVELSLVSPTIQNTIKNVTDAYDLNFLNSVVIRSKTQFRYFISDNTVADSESYGIIGCYRSYTDNPHWEFGELLGFHTNCAWSGYNDSGFEVIYHGGYDGRVYIHDIGSTLDGANITSIYRSPYLDFSDTEIRKLFRNINVFCRTEGSVTLSVGLNYNWGSITAINPADYQAISIGSEVTYDSGAKYDDGSVYASIFQPIFPLNVQGSAQSVQIVITCSGNFSSHTVQGIVVELSVKGRE